MSGGVDVYSFTRNGGASVVGGYNSGGSSCSLGGFAERSSVDSVYLLHSLEVGYKNDRVGSGVVRLTPTRCIMF